MASPLLLVVHGRTGGVVPVELQQLASELAQRRGAPVLLQALTASEPPQDAVLAAVGAVPRLIVVPLMLLPGAHVRVDLPAIAAYWRSALGPGVTVWRVPFVGAWPQWQQALLEEMVQLKASAAAGKGRPWLLHHPLEGPLGQRYLQHLARMTQSLCCATPYSADQLAQLQLSLTTPALPLALAANRMTDCLAEVVGSPLLLRPRFHQVLLDRLEALP